MKKILNGIIVLLGGAFLANAQGTVSFANYLALSSYIYVTFQTYHTSPTRIGGNTGPTTGSIIADLGNGNDWSVALYGNAGLDDAASTLVECTVAGGAFAVATLAGGISAGDATPGTWFSTLVADIPGTTGAHQSATLQVYAWYNDGGTLTYDQAAAGAYPNGKSASVNLANTGGNNLQGGPSLTAPNLPSGLGDISIVATVPEPSPIVLCLISASGFFMYRRKRGT